MIERVVVSSPPKNVKCGHLNIQNPYKNGSVFPVHRSEHPRVRLDTGKLKWRFRHENTRSTIITPDKLSGDPDPNEKTIEDDILSVHRIPKEKIEEGYGVFTEGNARRLEQEKPEDEKKRNSQLLVYVLLDASNIPVLQKEKPTNGNEYGAFYIQGQNFYIQQSSQNISLKIQYKAPYADSVVQVESIGFELIEKNMLAFGGEVILKQGEEQQSLTVACDENDAFVLVWRKNTAADLTTTQSTPVVLLKSSNQ